MHQVLCIKTDLSGPLLPIHMHPCAANEPVMLFSDVVKMFLYCGWYQSFLVLTSIKHMSFEYSKQLVETVKGKHFLWCLLAASDNSKPI